MYETASAAWIEGVLWPCRNFGKKDGVVGNLKENLKLNWSIWFSCNTYWDREVITAQCIQNWAIKAYKILTHTHVINGLIFSCVFTIICKWQHQHGLTKALTLSCAALSSACSLVISCSFSFSDSLTSGNAVSDCNDSKFSNLSSSTWLCSISDSFSDFNSPSWQKQTQCQVNQKPKS